MRAWSGVGRVREYRERRSWGVRDVFVGVSEEGETPPLQVVTVGVNLWLMIYNA